MIALASLLTACADRGADGESEKHSAAHDHAPSVECGASTYRDGHQVIRYCGEGSADVSMDGAEGVAVSGATCEAHGSFVTANVGTNYSNPDAAEGDYVGILLGNVRSADVPKPATVTGIEVTLDGRRVAVSDAEATATLVDGSFQATVNGRTPQGDVALEVACPVK